VTCLLLYSTAPRGIKGGAAANPGLKGGWRKREGGGEEKANPREGEKGKGGISFSFSPFCPGSGERGKRRKGVKRRETVV